ncbi:MAG: hypothetical protein ACKOBX_07250 [Bacteroidota bacterium]
MRRRNTSYGSTMSKMVVLTDWYLNYHIRDRLVYYSTLNEDEKKEYELWFNHVKEGRIDGLVFK